TLCGDFAAGREAPMPQLPIQYVCYGQWQRGWLLGEVLEKQLSYWRKKLGGQLPLLALPYDHARPAVQTFQGGQYRMELPDLLFTVLNRLSRRDGVGLLLSLLWAFRVLLVGV